MSGLKKIATILDIIVFRGQTGMLIHMKAIFILAVLMFILPKSFSQCTALIGTNLDPAEGCNPFSLQFTDLSTGVISRTWDFGDGSPVEVAQNPFHSFTTGERDTSYTVKLTITCASGTSNTTKTVKVFANPTVNFALDKPSVCAITDSVCLDNRSGSSAGNSYLWNFGDGTISEQFEMCKTYSTPDVYDISLTIINEKGCLGSLVREDVIKVERIPSTAFSVNAYSGCRPFNVVFTNNTDTVGNDYSNWVWDFGDGEPSFNGFEPVNHVYTQQGEYTVTLGTTNSLGCFNYSTQKITVKPAPVAQFSVSSPACQNENLKIEYTGSYISNPIFQWGFDSPVSVSGSGEGPYLLKWSEAGNKDISLTVNEGGCSSSVSQKIQINPITKVYVNITSNYDTICSSQAVTFVASPENYMNYKFYVNTNVVQNSSSNIYTGNSFNNNDKIYTGVTDINGCTQIISDTLALKVIQAPVISLIRPSGNDTICFGDQVNFTALPAGYEEYSFFIGNTEVQTSSSNTFSTGTLTNNERVYAQARLDECISQNTNNIYTSVKAILPAPEVNCGNSTLSSVEFLWDEIPGATGYEISLNSGPFVVPSSGSSGLSHFLTGLAANDENTIIVRAKDEDFCGNGLVSSAVTCIAIACDEISFKLIDQTRLVCEGEIETLVVSQVLPSNYSVSWDGGSYGQDTTFQFTALNDRTYNVSVMNENQDFCPPVEKSFNIKVSKREVLSLSSSAGTNTVNRGTLIRLTASPSSLQTYRFYDNNILVQQGPDNVLVLNNPINGHRIQAIAQNLGCSETSNVITLKVVEPLETPEVNYVYSTEDSVVFQWEPVSGAQGYIVSVNGGPFITVNSADGLSHTVSPLVSGDAVTISVIALGDGITTGNSEGSQPSIGFAEYCYAFDYTITQNSTICKGDSITLVINGLSISNYEITWGEMPPSKLKFYTISPSSDIVIPVAIKNLDKPFCPRQISYISIKVVETPGAVTLASSDINNEICDGDWIRFTASPLAYELYEFYRGSNLITSGTSNTYQTTTLNDGLSIRARALNQTCAGEFSNTIITEVYPQLRTPQLNPGGATDSSVYFVWDAIPGALGYNISIDGSPFITPSSGPYGLSHTVSDLAKNTVVKAIIIALGDGPCGNSLLSDETSNTAIECEPITYTIDPYKSICEGKQITLDASTINIPNFRVSWNSGPYEASATKIYIGDKDTIFTVSVKNLNQPLCPSVDKQFEIEVTPVPAITLFSGSANDTICEGSEVEFLVLPEEYDRYVFYNGTTIVQDSDSSRFVATNLANGNDISAEVFSNECSSKSNSIKTTVIPAKNLSLAANRSGILCTNEIVQFTATQGFERYYFFDNESIVLESPNNIVDININSASITVTAIDEYNCSSVSSDTLDFSLLPLPEVEISCSVDTICLSEFASYIAEPDGLPIYQFFMNDTLLLQGNSRNIYSTDSLRSGNRVSVVGIDNNGCRSRNSVSEFPYIRPYPASEIGSEAEGICLNDSVKLFVTIDSAFPSAHYYWSTGQNSDTIKVSPLYTSKYSLYFNLGKCKNTVLDTKYITVDRETPPVANAGEDVTICIYDSIQLEASGGLNYLWNNEFTLDSAEIFNPLAKPLTTTTYLVSVRNNFCFSIDSVTVTVGLCLKDIPNPVPQIITPNNDGLNDFWEVENVDYFENNHVEIYNRWGNLVYKASPYDNTWDGKNSKGYDLPEGTFFYILDLGKEGTKLRTGFIIIKR